MEALVIVLPGLLALLVVGVMNAEHALVVTTGLALEAGPLHDAKPLLLPLRVFQEVVVARLLLGH